MKKLPVLSVLAAVTCAALAQETAEEVVAVPSVSETIVSAPVVPPKVEVQTGDTDVIDLEEIEDSAVAAKKKPEVKLAKPPPKTEEEKLPPLPGQPVAELANNLSALVDIQCDEATLSDILRQFRKTTGANIISAASSNLEQRVSVSLTHVPWLQALESILNTRGFRLEPRGDIYFVSEDKLAVPVFMRTFNLKHASSTELADLFNTTLASPDAKKDPKTGKLLQPIATAFEGANVVVVKAPEQILSECENIIKRVDIAVPQLYIEARFIEISDESLHKLGMQWNQLASWGATAKGMTGGMEYNSGRSAVYKSSKESNWYTPKDMQVTSSETGEGKWSKTYTDLADGHSALDYVTQHYMVPKELNAAPGAGRQAADMSWLNARGFSGQLSLDDFYLAMSAFEQMSDVKIFSNPKIIVSNGKDARVDMTTKFPHVKITSQRNSSSAADYLDMSTEMQVIPGEDKLMFAKEAFFSWGITLDVLQPRISPDGLISVRIVPTISQLDRDVTPSGFYQVSSSDAGYGMYPIIAVKRLTTDFTMKDGATAVIGGLSKTTEEDVDSGIPYLRKIPYIGPKLFGWKSRGKVQKEILVFVTIGIADPAELPADIGLPKNAVMGREFVEGRKLEPGDRENAATTLMRIDERAMEEIRRDDATKAGAGTGSVTITPVRRVSASAVNEDLQKAKSE